MSHNITSGDKEKIMGTLRQKEVAKGLKEIVETGEVTTAKAILAKVGYSKGMQKQPVRILGSEGVKEELAKLGITTEKADKKVSSVLETGKDETALRAADLIYKRLGAYADKVQKSVNINVDLAELKKLGKFAEGLEDDIIADYEIKDA